MTWNAAVCVHGHAPGPIERKARLHEQRRGCDARTPASRARVQLRAAFQAHPIGADLGDASLVQDPDPKLRKLSFGAAGYSGVPTVQHAIA